jgi:competence protein ComEC
MHNNVHGMLWGSFALGYVMGIGLGLFWAIPMIFGLCIIVASAVALAWWHSLLAWEISLMLLGIAIGCTHAQSAQEKWRIPLKEYEVSGIAYIVAPPQSKETSQMVIMDFEECEGNVPCPNERVAVSFDAYQSLRYGESFWLTCPLTIPKSKDDSFDYRMYEATRGVGFLCWPKSWHKRDDATLGQEWLRTIFGTREVLEKNFDKVVAYPESGLGKGLLFGGSSALTKELQQDFSKTGMSHIVAVSGANVVIVAECFFLVALAVGLWRKHAIAVALIGVWIFVVMVGANASAVRAGIMGSMILLAQWWQRRLDNIQWLIATAALMLAFNPLLLRYDLSFQLSFLATFGILLLLPWFEKFSLPYQKNIALKTLYEIVWVTLAAELFVIPFIAFQFHTISTVFLGANLLVLPVIPFAMLFGFVASLCVFLWIPLAQFFGTIAFFLLKYMLSVIVFLASFSWAQYSW